MRSELRMKLITELSAELRWSLLGFGSNK